MVTKIVLYINCYVGIWYSYYFIFILSYTNLGHGWYFSPGRYILSGGRAAIPDRAWQKPKGAQFEILPS